MSWWTSDRGLMFALVEDPTPGFYSLDDSSRYVDALVTHTSQTGLSLLEMWGVLASPSLHGKRVTWAYFAGSSLSFPSPWVEHLLQDAAKRNDIELKQGVYSVE